MKTPRQYFYQIMRTASQLKENRLGVALKGMYNYIVSSPISHFSITKYISGLSDSIEQTSQPILT